MLNIVTFTKFSDELTELIYSARGDISLTVTREKDAAPLLPTADILIGFGGMLNWKDIMPQAKKCRWVHTLSAGVDRLTALADFVASETILTNSKGIHGVPMGEQVLGIILGFSRRLYAAYDQQKAHLWKPLPGLAEIAGKTAVIVGLGAVGCGIAAKLRAMDVRIVGVKQHVAPIDGIDRVYPQTELDAALKEGDFVIVALPVTPDTRNLFNLDRFRQMKKTALFLNVSRGQVVVEDDLRQALAEGAIAGAGLDVFATEPLAADSPLWDTPNLIVTPHNAALSPLYMARTIRIFAENLKVFPDAAKMINVVDKVRGY